MGSKKFSTITIRSYTVFVMVAWTILMIGLVAINVESMQDHLLEMARIEARTSIQKDFLYRTWNSHHGGVYVPVTEDTQPNPYIAVPEREVTTSSGQLLTLMNPAYMNRQVFKEQNATGTYTHVTSLNPLNPLNMPDEWEKASLMKFEEGDATEISSVERLGDEEYMRLIVPFITTEGCLKCHADQGYELGDVYGGLSISVPLSNYDMLKQSYIRLNGWGYGIIWLVGIFGIYVAFKRMKKHYQEREVILSSLQKSHRELEASEERYRNLFDEMMDGFALHEVICDEEGRPIDYRFLAVNPAFEKLTGLRAADIIHKTVLEVMPQIEKIWIERYGRVALTGEPDHFEDFAASLNTYFEVRAFSPAPNQFAVAFHDISQRKYSENITMARVKIVEIATTHSLDELVQTILDEAEAMTGSRIGFYHFMEPDQKTITLQTWSTRTLNEFCHTEGKRLHYTVESADVWVDCVHARKPIIHNDYASLPHRKGLPEGHAEIIRELVVPIMSGDRVTAILGVGNKQTDYTQMDMDIVQQLADLAIEIVERKRAEDAQLKVQQNYENLIQTVDGIVWEADAKTFKFSFVSDQAERLLGYSTRCWLDISDFWADHIHPEDRAEAIDYCVSQTCAGQGHEMEYRMIAEDGRIVWLRDMISVLSENGQPSKLRGIMIDITAKKLAEEKLHQLSLAVEQSPASVVITDLNGQIQYVNPKFTQITGYTREEAIGKNPRILKSGRTPQEKYKTLWETITSGRIWQDEFHNRKKNGELFWEDVMIAPLTDEAGRITHFVAVKEDITERKRAEKEIIEKNADLAALFTISTHLRTAASANDMLPLVLEEMRNVFHTDTNAVILLEAYSSSFILAMVDGALAPNSGVRFNVENSISGTVMQTRKPYVTLDFANDPDRTAVLKNCEHLGPAVLVPLQSETEFIGNLLCARCKDSPDGEFTSTEIQLLSSIGEMVGTALRRAKLYDDALLRLKRVQGLRAIDAAITSNMDLNITLKILLNEAITLMGVDAADIYIFNPVTRTLNFGSSQGFNTTQLERTQIRLGEGVTGRAALEREPVSILDISTETDLLRKEIYLREGIQSIFIAPMVTKGQMRGVLELYNRKSSSPNDEWLDFLEALSSQAAIAIDNSQLYNDLQHSNLELSLAYDKTIEGWSHALDLKDKETEGHTQRVTEWTIKLATLAGMSEAEIVHIRRGALLHDIGKMGIPDHILLKPDKLSDEEWQQMRMHTVYAYNMIKPIEFLRPAIDIPYCHHEKWDGSGYPRGLIGEQIPYAARLFAIIDVWDAVTSDRPYRKAWSPEQALEYIKSESGKQFDPAIVEIFLKIVDELKNPHPS